MIGTLGRRALEIGVGFFALLGFFSVPLGERTAFEHTRAILATDAATRAGRDLLQAFADVRQRIADALSQPAPVQLHRAPAEDAGAADVSVAGDEIFIARPAPPARTPRLPSVRHPGAVPAAHVPE